ncbi:MAG: hypothetical protein PHV33_00345 [Elusimicrobiales bacterium]|nr:hypothetical protein [Elusimicrobiales bacterium]
MAKTEKKPKAVKKIGIDYPKTNEVISGEHYAVRISTAPCDKVELSIDGGAWANCANSSGFWWFHLSGLAVGTHRLAARVKIDGETSFAMRKFEVSKPA